MLWSTEQPAVGNRAEGDRFHTSIYFIKPLFHKVLFTNLRISWWLFITNFSPDLERKKKSTRKHLQKSFQESGTHRRKCEGNFAMTEDVMTDREVWNCKTGKLEVTAFKHNESIKISGWLTEVFGVLFKDVIANT